MKWLWALLFLVICACATLGGKKDPPIDVESAKWDDESQFTVIRLNNGKVLNNIEKFNELDFIRTLTITGKGSEVYHVFLFRRTCIACDSDPDLYAYVYENGFSQALALPGPVRDEDTGLEVGSDRVFIGKCTGLTNEVIDFWEQKDKSGDKYTTERLILTDSVPSLERKELNKEDYSSLLTTLPKENCEELK
jgi:hypothetical protein